MIFRLHRENGARNSVSVFDAMEQGLRRLGHDVAVTNHPVDVTVIWSQLWHGRMRANQDIWQHHVATKRPLWIIEVGALDRNRLWRITQVGLPARTVCGHNHERARDLGIQLKPWHDRGRYVLIALQNPHSQQWSGMPDVETWLRQTVSTLKTHTDREIVIRPHPRCRFQLPKDLLDQGCRLQAPRAIPGTYDDFDFEQQMLDTWAVVNWNSHPGIRAVINGVPAFVGADSAARPVATPDLACIEHPARPDRQQWLNDLAWQEWTLAELASGVAQAQLLGQ